jgi:hypothetical protein
MRAAHDHRPQPRRRIFGNCWLPQTTCEVCAKRVQAVPLMDKQTAVQFVRRQWPILQPIGGHVFLRPTARAGSEVAKRLPGRLPSLPRRSC